MDQFTNIEEVSSRISFNLEKLKMVMFQYDDKAHCYFYVESDLHRYKY